MDASELLQGIKEFYIDILPKASSSSGWTEDNITNAINWANFCEQVYYKYESNQCRKKIDELIHCLPGSIHNPNQSICFKDLEKSSEVLCKAFYENPSVPNDLVESLFKKLKNEECSLEVKIEKGHNLDALCTELLEALKPIKIINSDRSFYSEVKAVIYLESLKAAVRHMTSEEEVENYLSVCLERLCENTKKMEQLLEVLLLNSSAETLASTRDIQEFAVNWTMYKILFNKNCPLALFIWKHPTELRRISLNSSDFLSFYLEYLTECASLLTSISADEETEWVSRSSDIGVLSFHEILGHLRSLLNTDDGVSETTKEHLINIVNSQPDSMIWKEIFSCVT